MDTIVPPRTHDHDGRGGRPGTAESRDAFARLPAGIAHLAGRSRENKLVHVAGSPDLLGRAGRRSDRPRRAVRAPGELPERLQPLASARRHRRRRPPPARPGSPSRSRSGCSRAGSRPRSCPRTRGRSTAVSTSARPRRRPRSGPRVVHHGLDLVDPDQPYSVADFRTHALAALGGARRPAAGSGSWPAAPGSGCGPSSRASTRTPCPSDAAVRAALEADLARDGRRGARRTPGGAGARPGRPHGPAQPATRRAGAGDRHAPGRRAAARRRSATRRRSSGCSWSSTPPSTGRRIVARARAQFDAGLVEEARALRERFDPALPAFSAIGYRESWAVLDGQATLEAAIELDAQRNVAFAKRQRTWFRAEPSLAVVDATADPAPRGTPLAGRRSWRPSGPDRGRPAA